MVEESNIFEGTIAMSDIEQGFHNFKLLTSTAYANLYVAHRLGKRFLIKTTKDNNPGALRILKREYELSITSTHPHIVHTYTFEPDLEIGQGIVMEYIEGCTLVDYLAKNPPRSELQRIFSELLSAVGYLHKRGIIHNDLKPENILITHADNSLKLIDFGLADSDAEYALRTLGCTPRYASPELRERTGAVDARSDIYSIGVIMEQMFGVSRISKRCKAESPAHRYENIESLERAWRRRNWPYYFIGAVVAVALLVIPSLSVLNQTLSTRRHEVFKQSVVCQMERDVEAICRRTIEALPSCRYVEFSTMEIAAMQERCSRYLDSLTTAIDNSDVEVAVNVRYSKLFQRYWMRALELSQNLNLKSYHIEVSSEYWPYYDSLVDNRIGYKSHLDK